jgi:uncharacterized phage protein (TIGR02218 family)
MRAASAGLISLLLSRQPTWQADLFTFSLLNGTTLRLCSSDKNITYGGNTWIAANAGSVGITRNQWSIKNTLDVPSLEIDIISSGTDYAGGANMKLAIHNGLLDGAWITLDRAIMQVIDGVYGDTTLGVVEIFAGRTGQVQVMSTGAKITVRGANILMNQYMPKNIFMTSCLHSLYDAGCTMVESTYTFAGVISTASLIAVSWVSDPTSGNYADLVFGLIEMTSGAALGETRTIGISSSTGVAIYYPWYVVPSPGDTFNVVYGCDKTMATCTARFANIQHFRGFPFVPVAETAIVA